jgi:DNA modification methylase
MTIELKNGDCLELMKNLPDKSIDLFICDLPYGETNCKWDSVIDLEEFWKQFKRLRKSKKTACIHFCSTKFGYTLINSWEKGFKMDMVWKKRNKTGGLLSRHRPMRNHEMLYFFYEQSPKYNRDKYHKRIKTQNTSEEKNGFGFDSKGVSNHGEKSFELPNPASVIEGKEDTIYSKKGWKHKNGEGFGGDEYLKKIKEEGLTTYFEPPNPVSVVEAEDPIYGEKKAKRHDRYLKSGTGAHHPPCPGSVVEETGKYGGKKYTQEHLENNRKGAGTNNAAQIFTKDAQKKFQKENGANFDPPNPASVVEEKIVDEEYYKDEDGNKTNVFGNKAWKGQNITFSKGIGGKFYKPGLPTSIFDSQKVFIGKRHHQTEKPQDILEFFLKYWTDEGDTVLDPTMGSGSTGVACKKMGRNFIGIELDEKIFKVAESRCAK